MADENIVSGKKYKVLQDGIWKIFSFFTKASDVEFDDGMNAEEKIKDIEKNGLGVDISLADYEALSEEEKKSGTYWINDSDEPLSDGSRFLKTTDVVDGFDSSDPTVPLSANMGRKIIEGLLWKKVDITSLSNATIAYPSECHFCINAYEIKISLQLRIDTVYGTEISILSLGSSNRPVAQTALCCNSSFNNSTASAYVTQEGYINIRQASVGEYLAISGSWIRAENTI